MEIDSGAIRQRRCHWSGRNSKVCKKARSTPALAPLAWGESMSESVCPKTSSPTGHHRAESQHVTPLLTYGRHLHLPAHLVGPLHLGRKHFRFSWVRCLLALSSAPPPTAPATLARRLHSKPAKAAAATRPASRRSAPGRSAVSRRKHGHAAKAQPIRRTT